MEIFKTWCGKSAGGNAKRCPRLARQSPVWATAAPLAAVHRLGLWAGLLSITGVHLHASCALGLQAERSRRAKVLRPFLLASACQRSKEKGQTCQSALGSRFLQRLSFGVGFVKCRPSFI